MCFLTPSLAVSDRSFVVQSQNYQSVQFWMLFYLAGIKSNDSKAMSMPST